MIERELVATQLCGASTPFGPVLIENAVVIAVLFERAAMPLTEDARLVVEVSADNETWTRSESGHTGDLMYASDGRPIVAPWAGIKAWAGGVARSVWVRGELRCSPPFVTRVVAQSWQ